MYQSVNNSFRAAKTKVKNLNKSVDGITGAFEQILDRAGLDTKGLESQAKLMVGLVEEVVKETVNNTLEKADRLRSLLDTDEFAKIGVSVKTLENFQGDLPTYESSHASGFDVRAQLNGSSYTMASGERYLVPTGLSFEIPEGFEIQARPRSGLAIKSGITVLNTPGTIDADYRGEVKIILVNHGNEPFEIEDQSRIAQLVLCPVFQAEFEAVEKLGETVRGEGGFGSTGH